MSMFSFRIVVHYSHTIDGGKWEGSTAYTAQTMWMEAYSRAEFDYKLQMSGLVPVVGCPWGMGGVVTQVDLNVVEYPNMILREDAPPVPAK